jgi:hypothetical protein
MQFQTQSEHLTENKNQLWAQQAQFLTAPHGENAVTAESDSSI